MVRRATGKPQGASSHFEGEKKEWLESFHEDLVAASDDPGSVYTDVTSRFLMRYGYDLPFAQNVEGNPDDNPPDLSGPVDDVEQARRDDLRAKLRTKLGNWYRNRYRGKKVHAGAIRNILSSMQAMTGPGARPRLKPAFLMYSKLHYRTRVKPEFDKWWKVAKKTIPEKERISLSQDFVRTAYGKESAEFKEQMEEEAVRAHAQDLAEWKASRQPQTPSAENYHDALETLSEVGIPLADALAERLGAQVVILVVGPVGAEQGEVCLRTVFSDTANAATSKTWAQFDHKGFTAMEASITRYGRAAFTPAQCRERAWPPIANTDLPTEGLFTIRQDVGVGSAVNQNLLPPPPVAPVNPNVAPSPPPVNPVPPLGTAVAKKSSATTPPPVTSTSQSIPPPVNATTNATTTLPADALGDTTVPDEPAVPDDGFDRTEWEESLTEIHPYLVSKPWGPKWEALVTALVDYEWSYCHLEEGGKLKKGKFRPGEYALWMKEHRPPTDYRIDESFGGNMMDWWKELGPKTRWENVGDGEGMLKEPDRTQRFWSGDWARLQQCGRNGPMLIVLGLAWWGQSICNAAAGDGLGAGEAALAASTDWQFLVEDLKWVFDTVLYRDRAALDAWELEKKAEAEAEKAAEAEAEAEKAEAAGRKAGKAGKAAAKPAKAAAKPGKAAKSATDGQTKKGEAKGGPKRKRAGDGEGDSSRPTKKVAKRAVVAEADKALPVKPAVTRPKPRPMTRGSAARKATEEGGSGGDVDNLTPPTASTSVEAQPDNQSKGAEPNSGEDVQSTSVDSTITANPETSSLAPKAGTGVRGEPPIAEAAEAAAQPILSRSTDMEVDSPVQDNITSSIVRDACTPSAAAVAHRAEDEPEAAGTTQTQAPKSSLSTDALSPEALAKALSATEFDPFAEFGSGVHGLTAEELAEIENDVDADVNESDDNDN
ncbi:hypothetical protein C8R47DRAFT_1226660 [Mycena vitilis]|nr:hypothetical protein C8R47DRAFT_1226660 [Mycena vitilis]